MAPQLTFGAILAEAREHKGLDVGTAARRLRIRPDILRAIEAEDFSRMPPRGYARNMINAYARLVGLNPAEITRMYLDAAYAFQVGQARSDSLPRVGGGSSRSRQQSAGRNRTSPAMDNHPIRQNALGRSLYDDRRNFTRGDYDAPAPSHSTRGGRTHPSRHAAMPHSHYTNFYAGPQGNGSLQSKLPFVIAGVIILVLLIVILVLVFGPKESQNQTGENTVPITGLDDTTQTGDGQQDSGQEQTSEPVLTAPESVTVEYVISDTSDAYVEIAQDGEAAQPAYLPAGTKESIDVTGTWSISTWTTNLVEVTVDGEPVEFTQDGTSIPTCTVDFEAYLEQWLEDHPGATAPASTGSSASDDDADSDDEDSSSTNTASSSNGSSSSSGSSSNSSSRSSSSGSSSQQ